jgi:copper chaperone
MNKTIRISGMHCASCVNSVESGLKKLDGVKSAKVNLEEGTASVSFDEKKLGIEVINEKISELGYTPEGNSAKERRKGFLKGLLYAIIPHTGCILFIIASVLGATAATQIFKPLLMNRNFLYILLGISFGFATVSSMVYLKQNRMLSGKGIRKSAGYLAFMYGATIGLNLILFLVIFPALSNVSAVQGRAGNAGNAGNSFLNSGDSALVLYDSVIKLQVQIPCSGHAPLITGEIKKLPGIGAIKYSFLSNFEVKYSSALVSKEQILGIEVFKTYPAKEIV